MANIREIQGRINSVKDTMKITNAMYMISSSKLTQAKKKLSDTEPYFYALQGEISRILRHIPELEQQLLEMLKENVPLHIFVGHLLSGTDYLTAGEIRETLTKIQNFENKSDAECRKIFADQLMDQKAYIQAISVYDSILNQDNVRNQPQLFMGDIWHNMGTAYARLFLFPQAADCFEMAYQRNRRDDSLNALLLALLMGNDGEGMAEKAKKFRVPEAYIQRAREQMEAAGESRAAKSSRLRLSLASACRTSASVYRSGSYAAVAVRTRSMTSDSNTSMSGR